MKDVLDTALCHEVIDGDPRFSAELKRRLRDHRYEKHWFSEAKDCFNRWDIEHCRRKITAKDADGTEHEAYWWLAFDCRNLRICGNVGK